ncbi:zf-CCHC domain containing [Paramuricea clavata]|uniref:Zf-CCHC domain containing n=1 Tax=Paramuricea clavata TaxID=317549 RepID=A0A7D9I9E0_PARCT|nr:zf-CCHC domain containing [Paramuricea clavata]CAB4022564.1 zf-CCHC domain containing [Paramuricea clavata]
MATSSRTSVALPETFSDGDIVLWLRKFELCSTANDWKDTDMLKRLPTLLSGKAFAVFERLAAEAKEDYKTLTKALTAAFGGDTTGKHLAMMAFRSRTRKPDEDIQVFAYNLEALLRRAMPKIENGDRDVLLQQQFIEGVPTELKRELLQRPSMSYEEMVAVAQQLDLVSQISSHQTGSQVNLASASDNLQTTTRDQPLVAQLMENVETLTRKVSELSVSVANVNATSARNSTRGRRGPCYQCGKMGHIANECRSTGNGSRQPNYRQRSAENYCFVCGQIGHFARECRFRYQSPVAGQPRQGNDQGPTHY